MPAKQQNVNWVAILGIVASVVGIGGTLYWINKDKGKREDLPEEEGYTEDELAGSNLSPKEALRRGNSLFTAMDGGGTNENSVIHALTAGMPNASALKLIYVKFGKRQGTYTWTSENLGQWFAGEGEGILKITRAIWENRGLTPPF